jgi:hypothetical protein
VPPKELAHFRKWFEEFEVQAWDKQWDADARSGKFSKIADQAIKNYHAGKAKEL